MSSPCLCVLCPPLHSCGAVHRLQWLWQRWWCWRRLRPGRRQWLLLWQWSWPLRWLQFRQWQRLGWWPQLCWWQQFHCQIHHHLILQQEELQALKSSSWPASPDCLRAPVQMHDPLFWLLLLSYFLVFFILELELKLLSALITLLCPYLLHLSFIAPYQKAVAWVRL